MYVELHTASAFSFLEGASTPEALVERAAALGYPALALLDRNGLYGAPRVHLAARRAGVKAIIGAELTIRAGGDPPPQGQRPGFEGALRPPLLWRLPVVVASREGYRHLCRLLTLLKRGAPKGEGALPLEALEGSTAGLVALVGRAAVGRTYYGVGGLLDRVIGLFGRDRVFVELQRHYLRDEEAANDALGALAAAFRVPVIATNGVRFATEADRPLFDVLTCLRHHTDLERAGRRLTWNAERFLKPPEAMAALFADLPHAVAATRALADRIEYSMADLGYRFPDYPVPEGETQASFLRKIAEVGARDRYRPYHARARAQVARELDLIDKLDLAGYFLIVWDIVNFCRRSGILVQGRGSAANSAVCYSLGITAVDPVGMDLLFERFLSEERGEWPDIDLDLPSGDRRERVIQYLYERYGEHGAAMTANVITYRSRSAAREVGKALGLAPAVIDRLAKLMTPFEWRDPQETLARHLHEAGLDAGDASLQLFADLWMRIQDLPRHLGQHSGGMVICGGRLDEVVPLEPATMPGRVVLQWDKDDCADMGIVKVDLLGLGMMAVLQDALTIINGQPIRHERDGTEREPDGEAASMAGEAPVEAGRTAPAPGRPGTGDPRGAGVDLAHLPPDDPVVYRMLQEADTIGVFQVESRAQMATLPRLKPAHFYDLVVEVAIIRPGPIVGQMVHPYLARRAGREPVVYAHPMLKPILERTLGVPLFQEQLLRMAMVVAGFTGGEAEELRRAMGFKRSEARMRAIEAKLRAGMAANGLTGATADEIVRSITSFALYGFPESHAASFALLVYASAYLKAYYPATFYAALLNNQPMGFYHPATLVKDAQRHGVRFKAIDVQASDWRCSIEADGAVRLGLCFVRGLREDIGRTIEQVVRQPAADGGGEVTGVDRAGSWQGAEPICPKCGADDPSMIEPVDPQAPGDDQWFCNVCAGEWRGSPRSQEAVRPNPTAAPGDPRFRSLDHFIAATGARRDELVVLGEIGALRSFGFERRGALWQVERAARPAGELFRPIEDGDASANSPLPAMSAAERVVADYAGTSLTIGPHPMALRRGDLSLRGVLRAVDLPGARAGRRVRVAGAVITRQRPGTAKGFAFLTLEDETGISNVIVRPDLFDRYRAVIVGEPFLMIEGVLQQQDGVTSIRADRLLPLGGVRLEVPSHDFH
jgi:error-prone DNA polymerase